MKETATTVRLGSTAKKRVSINQFSHKGIGDFKVAYQKYIFLIVMVLCIVVLKKQK